MFGFRSLLNRDTVEQPAPKPASAQVRPRTLRLEALEMRLAPSAPAPLITMNGSHTFAGSVLFYSR
jgi:hypothetical protein